MAPSSAASLPGLPARFTWRWRSRLLLPAGELGLEVREDPLEVPGGHHPIAWPSRLAERLASPQCFFFSFFFFFYVGFRLGIDFSLLGIGVCFSFVFFFFAGVLKKWKV